MGLPLRIVALALAALATPTKKATTAIVITVHGALEATRRCMDAVVASTPADAFRFYVVLDACDAATAAALRAPSHGRTGDVVLETNFSSYSKAANAGLRAALAAKDRHDAVALLNSDTAPSAGWLAGLRTALFGANDALAADDELAETFGLADADGDGFVTAAEAAAYGLRPGEAPRYASLLAPLDADGDGALSWAEACPPGPRTRTFRGCDGRNWTCARSSATRDLLTDLGLIPRWPAGAVGALSNAASYQTVPWPTKRRRSGWNVVEPPPRWSVETMARAARLAGAKRKATAGLLNGFLMLVSRQALEAVGLLDEATYPGGYGEENDWAVRARRLGFGLYAALGVHVFHEKTQSYSNAAKARLKAIARANSRAKWAAGEVGAAEQLLKRSPGLAAARKTAEAQYTGWRAKLLGSAAVSALVLVERGDAAVPAWVRNAAGAAVKSCAVDAGPGACGDYLAAPVYDYVVSTGPLGQAKADGHARCHPGVVHVRRRLSET